MGLRPEHIDEREARPDIDPARVIKASVEMVEMMGAEIHLTAGTGRNSLTARVDASCRRQVGDPVDMVLHMDKAHFFGGPEGRSLL
jgi:multiple sugar transport system ATP-binding protein